LHSVKTAGIGIPEIRHVPSDADHGMSPGPILIYPVARPYPCLWPSGPAHFPMFSIAINRKSVFRCPKTLETS